MNWIDAARRHDVRLVSATGDDPAIRRARQLHTDVYVKRGFLADGINWLDLERGLIEDPWVEVSTYVAVFDDDEPIGVARLIEPTDRPSLASATQRCSRGDHGLPAFDNFEILPDYRWVDPRACLEISSFAIGGPSTIYSGIFAHLFRGFLAVTVERSERYWVGIVEQPLLRVMQRYYHLPFETMGRSHRFMGGETMPVILDVPAYIAGLDGPRHDFLADTIDRRSLSNWLDRHLGTSQGPRHLDLRAADAESEPSRRRRGPVFHF